MTVAGTWARLTLVAIRRRIVAASLCSGMPRRGSGESVADPSPSGFSGLFRGPSRHPTASRAQLLGFIDRVVRTVASSLDEKVKQFCFELRFERRVALGSVARVLIRGTCVGDTRHRLSHLLDPLEHEIGRVHGDLPDDARPVFIADRVNARLVLAAFFGYTCTPHSDRLSVQRLVGLSVRLGTHTEDAL